MGFFGGKEKEEGGKKDGVNESQRLTGRIDSSKVAAYPATTTSPGASVPGGPRRTLAIRTFLLGLSTSDKLVPVPSERFEEGLRAALPKDAKIRRIEAPPGRESARHFEITLASGDMTEALAGICERGILDGQVQIGLDQCSVVCRAETRNSTVNVVAESVERHGARFNIHAESPDVLVQYPPVEVHRRWAPDDDYRNTYNQWRAQRSEPDTGKPARWSLAWPLAASDEGGNPPWIKLRAKEGKADEHGLEFDERVFLRFAVHGADITINRFNLKVLVNKVTSEYAVYRSLPLSLETIPKDIQDRMNREPERFKVLREPGKFGASFDLVRQAYEEAGGDYFQLENPASPTRAVKPAAPSASYPRPAIAEVVTSGTASESAPATDPRTAEPRPAVAKPRPASTAPARAMPQGRPVGSGTKPPVKPPTEARPTPAPEVTKAFASTQPAEVSKAFSSAPTEASKAFAPPSAEVSTAFGGSPESRIPEPDVPEGNGGFTDTAG